LTGHENTNGEGLSERVEKIGGSTGSLAENLDYGLSSAKDVVLQLLIDAGIKNRGQRTNILSNSFQMMGAYSGPHAKWDTMSSIIYTWDFIDSPKDYALIESNLEKFLAAPVEDFPNPSGYIRYT
jgi:uncharacterized protein YkwD